jgi:hypothetical protein
VAFLFASVAIATLLGIVISLFIRWRKTGRSNAVYVLEKNLTGAGNIPLETSTKKAGEVVPPLADKKIQPPSRTGKSGAASINQDSAHSNSQPTYGELFPEIVSSGPACKTLCLGGHPFKGL